MFAGRRRRSSNIRAMQLFHELKQQFPTVPDHVVSACIHAHSATPAGKESTIRQILEAAAALSLQQPEPMGRHSPPILAALPTPPVPTAAASSTSSPSTRTERMIDGDATAAATSSSDCVNRNSGVKFTKKSDSVNVLGTSHQDFRKAGNSSFFVKRPDRLDIKPDVGEFGRNVSSDAGRSQLNTIQLSEKCRNVHKLLNPNKVNEKPPRSPLTSKRSTPTNAKSSTPTSQGVRSPLASPDLQKRLQAGDEPKKTASTPTQTTDTLLGECFRVVLEKVNNVGETRGECFRNSIVLVCGVLHFVQIIIQFPPHRVS